MKVTVCEFSEEAGELEEDWAKLVSHVQTEASNLVLLPEMPFYPWFPRKREFKSSTWEAALAAHETWLARLAELAPAYVLGSRPVEREGKRLNEGFFWDVQQGLRAIHTKYYLPDEGGFWEASWYQRGDGIFEPLQVGSLRIAFLICTELWFFERARSYGKKGVHLIANPRATELATRDKWLVAGRAAAVVSGAYCLSSNRTSNKETSRGLGGLGWVIGPDGEVFELTSPDNPYVTVDIDPEKAEQAKSTYPRYVMD